MIFSRLSGCLLVFIEVKRSQRRSDGTVSLDGIRFEIPQVFAQVASKGIKGACGTGAGTAAAGGADAACGTAGARPSRSWIEV
ncbi:MAG: hypothetical protein WA191_00920 [Telluria sp.]